MLTDLLTGRWEIGSYRPDICHEIRREGSCSAQGSFALWGQGQQTAPACLQNQCSGESRWAGSIPVRLRKGASTCRNELPTALTATGYEGRKGPNANDLLMILFGSPLEA